MQSVVIRFTNVRLKYKNFFLFRTLRAQQVKTDEIKSLGLQLSIFPATHYHARMSMIRTRAPPSGASGLANLKHMGHQAGGNPGGWGTFRANRFAPDVGPNDSMVDSQLTELPPGYQGSLLQQAR